LSWRVQVTGAVEELAWLLQTVDRGLFTQGRIYPGAERIPSRGDTMARFRSTPALAYCHDGATGLGLAAAQSDGVRAVASAIMPGPDAVQLAGYSEVLRWRKTPCEATFGLRLLVGLTPGEAEAWHRRHTPGLKPVAISAVAVEKLIYRSGEAGGASVALTNNSAERRSVRVRARIESGLDESRELPVQAVDLAAGETMQRPVQWTNDREYGAALVVSVEGADGQELDRAREFFAVADNFSRVGQMVVFNPGWMNREWMIPAWMEWARQNYLGSIEYYCWAPDQVFDLTPDTEEFEPHTESQGVYRARLTRSFLQSLVRRAHDAGLRVMAMDTGWASLQGALDHPEQMKHTREGQVYFFNGNIHEGRRYNAAGAHVYADDRVRRWACEMNASVDLFGWDGVRFDWNFLPVSPADPKFLGTENPDEGNRYEWFDVMGRSAHELFPNPDATGAALCRAWRETVAEKHPDFVYHENFQVSEAIQARLPQYTKAACSESGVLREGLLDVARHYPTWQKWVAALVEVTRLIRPLDGQPAVGWMNGYAPGSVSHRTLQDCMIAAGFHWYGTAEARGSIDDTHRRFAHALRFAEIFYDPGFLPVSDPAAVVQVAGDGVDRVLWQPFVYLRQRVGVRETLVHLVSLPQGDHIIQRHEEPPVRTGLTVTVSLPPGARVTRCRLVTPDPEPGVRALPWTTGAPGQAICQIPELRSLVSLVVEATVER
jgi:hypothetical protein